MKRLLLACAASCAVVAGVVYMARATELSPLLSTMNADNVTFYPGLLSYPTGSFQAMGVIFTTHAAVGTTTGTAEQTLGTYSLPANALDQAGRRLRIRAAFVYGATANNKTAKLYFGSEVITTPTAASNGTSAFLELTAVKSGSSTQLVWGDGVNATTPVTVYTSTSAAEIDTAAIVIKATCTDGTSAANDCTLVDFAVEYMN